MVEKTFIRHLLNSSLHAALAERGARGGAASKRRRLHPGEEHSPSFLFEFEIWIWRHQKVWGDVDEDGFYDGEILDGRRGLVPSNFVEKLEGDDLVDFHQQGYYGLTIQCSLCSVNIFLFKMNLGVNLN